MPDTSRLPGFYKKSVAERAAIIGEVADLSTEELNTLGDEASLTPELADRLIENVVGVYSLPMGIAANFLVNGREVLVPMVIEEPSVVAAASYMAKLARAGGGFRAEVTEPEMIGQIQVVDLTDVEAASETVLAHKDELLEAAAARSQDIISFGGGPRNLETRILSDTPAGPMLIVHLIVDTRDAMGANTVNTACEALTEPLERITGGRVGLRILSNLADRRLARAAVTIPAEAMAFGDYDGASVVRGIAEAYAFAAADPYRAATHNKGIMNGIDAVVMATGNDWRAVEAGAHAYAVQNGRYTSLTTWEMDDEGNLAGSLELPLALGIVGGMTRVHPTAQVALKILDVNTAGELAEIVAAVGLAQNLAALRALATEGIQKGHMALHARQIAISAGADGSQIDTVVARMLKDHNISPVYAAAILDEMKSQSTEGQS